MLGVKLWLATSPGGCRMDFLAGWLGKLDNFANSSWTIDPHTGRSCGMMQKIKNIDREGYRLEDVLAKHSFELDPNSDITFAGTCHGYQLNQFDQEIIKNKIVVLQIQPGTADHNLIKWEFFVKTYLSKHNNIHDLLYSTLPWTIDSLLGGANTTNAMRVQKLSDMMKNYNDVLKDVGYKGFPYITLDYTKLFVPGGSRYLCDQIGITAGEQYHLYWDGMLPLASSPNELTVWGHIWRRKDYFN
jgi:hypothetical protein